MAFGQPSKWKPCGSKNAGGGGEQPLDKPYLSTAPPPPPRSYCCFILRTFRRVVVLEATMLPAMIGWPALRSQKVRAGRLLPLVEVLWSYSRNVHLNCSDPLLVLNWIILDIIMIIVIIIFWLSVWSVSGLLSEPPCEWLLSRGRI